MISGARRIKPNEIRRFYIHPGENPPPQNGCRLKSNFFSKALVSHPPLSQFNQTFHKTNRPPLHYTPVLPGHCETRPARMAKEKCALFPYVSIKVWRSRLPTITGSFHTALRESIAYHTLANDKLTMPLFAVYQVPALMRVSTWIAGGAPGGAPAQLVCDFLRRGWWWARMRSPMNSRPEADEWISHGNRLKMDFGRALIRGTNKIARYVMWA
jgi:hypothetical protein